MNAIVRARSGQTAVGSSDTVRYGSTGGLSIDLQSAPRQGADFVITPRQRAPPCGTSAGATAYARRCTPSASGRRGPGTRGRGEGVCEAPVASGRRRAAAHAADELAGAHNLDSSTYAGRHTGRRAGHRGRRGDTYTGILARLNEAQRWGPTGRGERPAWCWQNTRARG